MAIDLNALGFGSGSSDSTSGSALSRSEIESALNDDSADDSTEESGKDSTSEDELSLADSSDDAESESDEEEEAEEESEDDKEDSEEEPEVNLEDEDELELAKIPKRQELKKAYPDIFKKFPALDHIIQREHAFAEVFPTVGDAKNAKESVASFNKFQSDLLSGDIEGVLSAVKQTDSKAFAKISENFLDSLIKVDPNAHLATTQKVTKSILNYIHSVAASRLKRNSGDEQADQLRLASKIIHEALYDTDEVTPYVADKASDKAEDNPEKEKFNAERAKFEKSRFDSAFQSISTSMNSMLTSAITRDIDTKGILPPYVKSTLVKDVMSELDRQLTGDTRFRGLIDKLWIKAKDSGYSEDSLKNIRTALKEKSKTILPGIMRAKKGEAMKGLTSHVNKKDRELKSTPKKFNGDTGASRESKLTNSRRDSSKLPQDNESNLDYLMRD